METADIIVVGGGPAGISAAITAARAGLKVILIERGRFSGAKNMFGGAIYTQPTKEIFPDFETSAPLERKNITHKYAILGEEDSTVVSYSNKNSEFSSYTVIRSKFDRWMAEEARKVGVIVVEETVVKELIVEDDCVVGVRTELEDLAAKIVILADGVNSLLAKQIGLREDIATQDVALSIKEVIKIGQDRVNERFGLGDNEGCVYQIFGSSMLGKLGLGFLYTNKESVSIGLGITLNELVENNVTPYELLDGVKKHPAIAPLIKDGELLEYSAHLIPEGGYKKVPQLYANGVMVTGDAGMLVNNLHWEGTNLAMISGKLAAETAILAIQKEDYSEDILKKYQEKLENSFVLKDLKTYRYLMEEAHKRKTAYFDYYFKKINGFFEMYTSVDSIPKREKYFKFVKDFFKGRGVVEPLKDLKGILKILWGVLR